jgi:hypothetical protein
MLPPLAAPNCGKNPGSSTPSSSGRGWPNAAGQTSNTETTRAKAIAAERIVLTVA